MVLTKENLNLVFITTRNHFEIEVMKQLSKYIWQLKDESKSCNIRWSIFMYATPYKCGTRRCDLCLTEKYVIARAIYSTRELKSSLNVAIEINI